MRALNIFVFAVGLSALEKKARKKKNQNQHKKTQPQAKPQTPSKLK